MKTATREILKSTIPPDAYRFVRYRWWLGSFYLPRLLGSRLVHRSPKVWTAGTGSADFVSLIRSVNTLVPTRMCRVMSRYGSDKGRGRHNYTMVYSALFQNLRDRPARIFELGLGTNNPTLASSMGKFGRPGASLRGWRELFPNAVIFGADIDRDILFQEDRIRTFYCDQLDSAVSRELWSQPELREPMDILIDDGLHSFEGNMSFLNESLDHIRPGGIYVVEDILNDALDKWRAYLAESCSSRFSNYDFALVELSETVENSDNNLLLIRRRA